MCNGLREQNALRELAIEAVGSELLAAVVATESQRECYEAHAYETSLSIFVGDMLDEVLCGEIHLTTTSVLKQERMMRKLHHESLAMLFLRKKLNRYWKM